MKLRYINKCKGWLYLFGDTLLDWHVYLHFRQINLVDVEKIRPNTPVIVASNHPTAFLDPVVLGQFSSAPLYFMARGDIFKNKQTRKILESFNMFPVNRLRDGFTDANRHEETNEIVLKSLEERLAICVFVEGHHHADKRVLPVQKGIARIAFAAYEKFRQEDLQIVPVGCNYWLSDRPRDVLYLNTGVPVFVRDYWEEYQQAPAAAMLRLSKDIQARLQAICFHINDTNDDEFCEMLLSLHRSEYPIGHFPVIFKRSSAFDAEKKVLDMVNQMPEERKGALKGITGSYFSALRQSGLEDDALVNPQWLGFGRWVMLVLGFPLFVSGWLMRFPVIWLAEFVVDNKIKKKEYKSSIYLGIEMFFGFFWYLSVVCLSLFSRNPALIGVAFLLPLLGWFSVIYTEVFCRIKMVLKVKSHPQRAALLRQRAAVKLLYDENISGSSHSI